MKKTEDKVGRKGERWLGIRSEDSQSAWHNNATNEENTTHQRQNSETKTKQTQKERRRNGYSPLQREENRRFQL